MIGDNMNKRRNTMPSFYPLETGTPENPKDIEKRKRWIDRKQAKIDICTNCKKECKTGTCEIFPHG